MTALRHAMSAYGQAAQTIPPLQQIVMLYDGAIRNLGQAKVAIENRRINDRWTAISKATAILEALQGCLDFDKGGEIAPQLDRLYTHYILRLQSVHQTDDPSICVEVAAQLAQLRDSWASIANGDPEASAPQEGGTKSSSVTI